MTVTFSGPVWQYSGPGAWYFVTLPVEVGTEIRALQPRGLKGFGSVRTRVTCAGHEWQTSIFPDKKSGSYLLPIKADVRKHLGLVVDQVLEITLDLD